MWFFVSIWKFSLEVACHGRITTKKKDSSFGKEIRNACTDKRRSYESHDCHPEPASGHQILCPDVPWDADLASLPECPAPDQPQVSSHTRFGSRWLWQDDVIVCLGTI